jgi:hypothetical protein
MSRDSAEGVRFSRRGARGRAELKVRYNEVLVRTYLRYLYIDIVVINTDELGKYSTATDTFAI